MRWTREHPRWKVRTDSEPFSSEAASKERNLQAKGSLQPNNSANRRNTHWDSAALNTSDTDSPCAMRSRTSA